MVVCCKEDIFLSHVSLRSGELFGIQRAYFFNNKVM